MARCLVVAVSATSGPLRLRSGYGRKARRIGSRNRRVLPNPLAGGTDVARVMRVEHVLREPPACRGHAWHS